MNSHSSTVLSTDFTESLTCTAKGRGGEIKLEILTETDETFAVLHVSGGGGGFSLNEEDSQ